MINPTLVMDEEGDERDFWTQYMLQIKAMHLMIIDRLPMALPLKEYSYVSIVPFVPYPTYPLGVGNSWPK